MVRSILAEVKILAAAGGGITQGCGRSTAIYIHRHRPAGENPDRKFKKSAKYLPGSAGGAGMMGLDGFYRPSASKGAPRRDGSPDADGRFVSFNSSYLTMLFV